MTTHSLEIPYPPSVNSYWGFRGHHRFLTPKAREFNLLVSTIVKLTSCPNFGEARLEVSITLFPKDKRIRDIDNSIKSTLDALCHANVYKDDSYIDVLVVDRGTIYKGGKALVTIKTINS